MRRSRDDDIYDSNIRVNTITKTDPKKARKICLAYIKDIKDVFRDKKEKLEEYFGIMEDYKTQRIEITGVIEKVKVLFKGHQNLILGFNKFLPLEYDMGLSQEDEPEAKKAVTYEEAMQILHKSRTRLQGGDHVYKSLVDMLAMYKEETKSLTDLHQEVAALLHNQPDMLNEFTNIILGSSAGVASNHDVHSSRTHKPHLGDRSSPRKIKILHSRNKNITLPDGHDSASRGVSANREQHSQDKIFDITELFHQDVHEQVTSLRNKVKERLQSSVNYQAFLRGIMHYCTKIINRPQLQSLVNDLLGAYPDLMEEVNELIDRCEKNGSLVIGHLPKSLESEDQNRDEDQERPIPELDLSGCERCTPSYRLLPKNYPIPSVSRRTDVGVEVLNDHWVSVTSGSEDYSFKHMRKNQYEESLLRCEDDRFELDMLIESVNSTTRRVEELLKKIHNNSIKTDSEVRIEDHLTALNLRCIERLYGDNRIAVMDVLKNNASLALPVILTRLKQKQAEWARCRFDFNEVWAEIYAKNYHKSLDHRSIYTKQQDSKSLSAKALLAEIKEISDKNSEDEKIYQYFASGERQKSTSHQEFSYCDLAVHEDIYQVMKYYISQNCTTEEFDKVMKIWTKFVEPVFNVPTRCHHIVKNVHESSCDSLGSETADEEERSPVEHDGIHDDKAESEDEAVEQFLETAKPLAKYVPATSYIGQYDPRIFYGNDDFYVFFRLHQTLYSRLKEAKEKSANDMWRASNETTPNDLYARFMDLLYIFLRGDADTTKYEDECRTVLGTWSFSLFTLDNLIDKISKQLLEIAMDEVDKKLISLYTYENMRKRGRYVDELYYANTRMIVNDDNIYRFESSLISEKDSQTQMTIRLMDPGCDTSEAPSFLIDANFESHPTNQLVSAIPGKQRAHIFLKRNKRIYAGEDEDLALMRAMEGVQVLNRMECKIDCITYKISYVLDTEDFMVRKGRKIGNGQKIQPNEFADVSNGYSHKVKQFHKLLQSRINIP